LCLAIFSAPFHNFSHWLRQARKRSRLSQLELAALSDVSQRHISFLKSGRSKPGRDVATRLASVLDLTMIERNRLLDSAGFAALYSHSEPDAPCMQPVLRAVRRMLEHHEPHPGVAMDRAYNVLQTNLAFDRLLHEVAPVDDLWQRTCGDGARNLLKLSLHPGGLRSYREDFLGVAAGVMERAEREARHHPELAEVFHVVRQYDGVSKAANRAQSRTLPAQGPVFFETYLVRGHRLRLFSVLSTMGAPTDVGAQALMVESFFPAGAWIVCRWAFDVIALPPVRGVR